MIRTLYRSNVTVKLILGQWIVTRSQLRNLGQVAVYVPVTGYNFFHWVRFKARVKLDNFEKSPFFENKRFFVFVCDPARALFFENRLFAVFVCDPAGGLFFEIDGLSFLFVTLPGAFFLK